MNFELHKRAMRRLRRAGVGSYVVITAEMGKAGLDARFPIGQIVGFTDPISVTVRKLGQRGKTSYAAGFWQPAPNRLINYIQDRGDA